MAAKPNKTYRIDVLVKGEWKPRSTVSEWPRSGKPVANANQALKAYGIAGTRPYLGEATSRSGKRFRAVIMPATKPGGRKKGGKK